MLEKPCSSQASLRTRYRHIPIDLRRTDNCELKDFKVLSKSKFYNDERIYYISGKEKKSCEMTSSLWLIYLWVFPSHT